MTRHARRSPRRTRLILVVLGAALGVGALTAGWLGLRAWSVRANLQSLAADVPQLQADLSDGKLADADVALRAVAAAAASAKANTDDPIWRVASYLPWAGRQLSAVSAASDAVDDLARNALPALRDAAGTLTPAALTPAKGHLDLARIDAAAPKVAAADA